MPEVISQEAVEQAPDARACAYRILRYAPNLVRDEWVNIGVLVFDPATGERRLRLIEEAGEFARVRRLHPAADEALLRALRDDIEKEFDAANDTADGARSWRSGMKPFRTRCSSRRKKACWPAIWTRSSNGSMPTMWLRRRGAGLPPRGREAGERFAVTATRSGGRRGYGSGLRN